MILVKFKDGRKVKGYVEYTEGSDYPFFSGVGKPSDRMVLGGSYKTFNEAVEKGFKATETRTLWVCPGVVISYCDGYRYHVDGKFIDGTKL